MRIQARPRFRASAGVTYPSFEAGAEGVRHIVQSKMWPANCRLLDPGEAAAAAGLEGQQALLVIGFESADVPQGEAIRQAVALAREAGGSINDDDILVSGDETTRTGRRGAVGTWRDSFLRAPYNKNITSGLGVVEETVETAITWDRWPQLTRRYGKRCKALWTASAWAARSVAGSPTSTPTDRPPISPSPGWEKWARNWKCTRRSSRRHPTRLLPPGHHHSPPRRWQAPQTLVPGATPRPICRSPEGVKRTVDPNGILNPGVLFDL